MGQLAVALPAVTVKVPVPGRVLLPISHVQLQTPPASAVTCPRPCAWLTVPAGVV